MAYSIRFPRRHDKADRNGRYAVRLCITKNKRRKYFLVLIVDLIINLYIVLLQTVDSHLYR